MKIQMKHLNTFRDTYDTPRDYPYQWARLYVPEGHQVSPWLSQNYYILTDKHQRDAYLHIQGHEYFGNLEELEPVLMAWFYCQGFANTRPIATQKELRLCCTQ